MKKLLFVIGVISLLSYSCSKDSENNTKDPEVVNPSDPTICVDAAGKIYKTVVIGQHRWMAENYAYLPSVFESSDYSMDSPRTYVYNYEGSDVAAAKEEYQYERYGVLYNYEAALEYCPKGWHLPTDSEWKEIEILMGMSEEQADMDGINDGKGNYRGTTEIMKKFVNLAYGGTNETGLDVLFAGSSDKKGFCMIMKMGNFWTSTKSDDIKAYMRGFALMPGIQRGAMETGVGLSVRYVKD